MAKRAKSKAPGSNHLTGEKSPYLLQHADNPVHWYPWGEEAFEKAWERFKEGRGLSFTDCSSFVLMDAYGISHAFTFNGHFKEAGFQILP